MSQITISLNPSVERKLKAAAKKRKVSINRWILEMIYGFDHLNKNRANIHNLLVL